MNSTKDDFPWWLLLTAGVGLYLGWQVWQDEGSARIFATLAKGAWITIFVTLIAFGGATLIGLVVAMGSLSRYLIFRQIARLYIEVFRGIPILVLLLYVAFVFAPALVALANWVLSPFDPDPIRTRDFSFLWRAVLALLISYSAYIAEVFRAGILSVERGQIEAAEALGLTRWQRFVLIILPQAIRTMLPPLGNFFIAMVKDSSLVSVLGVADLTGIARTTAAGNFQYFETYNILTYIYLSMTITLSLGLRWIEQRINSRPQPSG